MCQLLCYNTRCDDFIFKSRQKKCSDEPFIARILAIKSVHKSGEFYKVTFEFDDSALSDSLHVLLWRACTPLLPCRCSDDLSRPRAR